MNTLPTKSTLPWARIVLAVAVVALPGCDQFLHVGTWFNPTDMIRPTTQRPVMPVFKTIGPMDPTRELPPNATLPRPEDLIYIDEDYVIGPTDILAITILDLLSEGLEATLERQVSHSGYIDLPLLGSRMKAGGLTSEQLTEAIKKAYKKAEILREATVSVAVLASRQNTFNVLGAVLRPGMYNIMRKNFTLMEALALAGDVNQMGIDWVFVIRPKTKARAAAAPTTRQKPELPELPELPEPEQPTTQDAGPDIPDSQERLEELEKFIPGIAAIRRGAGDDRVFLSSVALGPAPTGAAAGSQRGPGKSAVTYKWVYSRGQWMRVPEKVAHEEPAEPRRAPAAKQIVASEKDPFGWMKHDMSHLARVIAINLNKLKAGDPRMNIIIRDNDVVQVPPLEVGEFYIMGHVLRPGVYNLTGRKITVKMAVAAAGNLAPLAWPNNSRLIRRIGPDQEQQIPLHLNDIFAGIEPDLFLKPNDVIAVGTHTAAPFLAVWRNAFRMTYGFGFIYDRNYSEQEFEIPIIAPKSGFRL